MERAREENTLDRQAARAILNAETIDRIRQIDTEQRREARSR